MDRYYTRVYSKNLAAFLDPSVRYIINMGGTSSSKTFSTVQLLTDVCKSVPKSFLISITSETFPHLQRGAMLDFETNLGDELGFYEQNKTNHFYKIGKSKVEFFSVDDAGRARGPRRNILYCNEVNNFKKEVFEDLEIRTDYKVIIDYNPTAEFWITELLDLPETQLIKSNHLDNNRLPDSIRKRIMQKAERDPNFKRVHIDVEWGSLDGLIFPSFEQIDAYPDAVDRERFGLDFGFNHPSALIRCGITEDTLYLDELFYQSGLITSGIIQKFNELGVSYSDKILADNSRPEQIEEIHQDGWFIQPCEKGKDSIVTGINKVKKYKIKITKRSVNLIKEFRNYSWMKDKKTGKTVEKPMDDFNHGCDAVRYAVWDMDYAERDLVTSL